LVGKLLSQKYENNYLLLNLYDSFYQYIRGRLMIKSTIDVFKRKDTSAHENPATLFIGNYRVKHGEVAHSIGSRKW
jgi:hypothetical protein